MDTEETTINNDDESDFEEVDDIDVDVDIDANVDEDIVEDKNDDDDEDEHEDDDENDNNNRIMPKKKHQYHQMKESEDIHIVHPSRRVTSEYMTLYEYSMVVGIRATHISNGSVLYTEPDGLYDPRDIAKKEINENKCPLSITRKVSPTIIEVWEVNEMIKPQ